MKNPAVVRQLLYQASRIPQLPFRQYFIRHIRETYPTTLIFTTELEQAAIRELEQMKRIVAVQKLYGSGRPLVIERGSTDVAK